MGRGKNIECGGCFVALLAAEGGLGGAEWRRLPVRIAQLHARAWFSVALVYACCSTRLGVCAGGVARRGLVMSRAVSSAIAEAIRVSQVESPTAFRVGKPSSSL